MNAHAYHNVATLLERSARAWPDLPAVALGAATLHDYATLARRAAALGATLRARGLSDGDRVILVAHNLPGYVEALFGCWYAGLFAVPVNAKLHPKELEYVIADSGARAAFVDAEWETALGDLDRGALRHVIRFGGAEQEAACGGVPLAAVAPVRASDGAWLFYTSGTTGRPKGVIISHGNLLAMTQGFLANVEAIAPGDAILHPAPLSHGSGLYVLPHVARAAVNVIPESGGFDAAEIAALLDAWDRALFFAAPTMLRRLVDTPAQAPARLAHLKCIVYGGGPMYVEDLKAAFAAFGPRLAQIYGQGESPMTITAMDRALVADAVVRGDLARMASVGVAQPGLDLRVADADDRALTVGAIGEVLVRGPTVMQGYWNQPEATARTLAGGWLHTGDVGAVDADGFLTLKDRSKDLIISGGANIYPREVEEVLLGHPGVAEAAVVGRRHADWGEEVVAFVVPRRAGVATAALEAELDAHCLAAIARFKRPRAYVFVAELPKNNTGKVLKTALREQLTAR